MAKRIKKAQIPSMAVVSTVIILASLFLGFKVLNSNNASTPSTSTASIRKVDSQIQADGVVTAQNQAVLHFQTSGKLLYLPFKEGDSVYNGQTIAQLDTYAIQRQLSQALNNYKLNRNSFDQFQANKDNGVLLNQQQAGLKAAGSGVGLYGTDTGSTNYIDDLIKRLAQENQADLDNSVINVELANYALQLSTITTPFNGIVTHEDVTVAGVNVTPLTSFTLADPSTMVFRANIPTSFIDYIAYGANAVVSIDGMTEKINGTVVKIYPSKITLSSGENAYQVDIQSDQLNNSAKLDQPGSVIISTNAEKITLVKNWTVLGGKYIWIERENMPKLIKITIGKTHGDEIEILNGLDSQDKIITDPKIILNGKYNIL